jgi:hypothetical protein
MINWHTIFKGDVPYQVRYKTLQTLIAIDSQVSRTEHALEIVIENDLKRNVHISKRQTERAKMFLN